MGGGVGGNHARRRRSQSEKAILRQCSPPISFGLKPEFPLNCLGVLSHSRSESLARQQTSVYANRKSGGENFDSLPIPESLYHGKLLKRFTGTEFGPIKNFRAPDVGDIENLEPVLGGVLFEALGEDLFDLVATPKALGLVRNFLERRQIEQPAQCRKMGHSQRQVTARCVVNSIRRRQVRVRIAERTSSRRTSPVIEVGGEHFKLEIE